MPILVFVIGLLVGIGVALMFKSRVPKAPQPSADGTATEKEDLSPLETLGRSNYVTYWAVSIIGTVSQLEDDGDFTVTTKDGVSLPLYVDIETKFFEGNAGPETAKRFTASDIYVGENVSVYAESRNRNIHAVAVYGFGSVDPMTLRGE